MNWASTYRTYLALRRDKDLAVALAAAPFPLKDYLGACGNGTRQTAEELLPSIERLFCHEDETSAITVRLAFLDASARLCEVSDDLELEMRNQLLQEGISACKEAIDRAAAIQDAPCMAFYQAMIAIGYRKAGDLPNAVSSRLRAVDLYRELCARDRTTYSLATGRSLNELAAILREIHEWTHARNYLNEAIAIMRPFAENGCEPYVAPLAQSLSNLGATLADMRELETAKDASLEACEIYRRLARDEPSYSWLAAVSLDNLGTIYGELHELQRAQTTFEESLSILRQLPGSSETLCKHEIARALNNLGNLQRHLRDPARARQTYEEALRLRRELAAVNPVHEKDVAMTLNNLGNAFRNLREPELARMAYQEALLIRRRWAGREPSLFLPDLANVLGNLGNILGDLRELSPALEAFREALAIERQLAQLNPAVYQIDKAMTLNNMGAILNSLLEFEEAQGAFTETLTIYRELDDAQPGMYQDQVAWSLANLASCLVRMGDGPGARTMYEKALKIRRELATAEPRIHRHGLAKVLEPLGDVLAELRELESARKALEEALAIQEELAMLEPKIYGPDVASVLLNLGNTLTDLGQLESARAAYLRSLEIYRSTSLWVEAALPQANLGRLERNPNAAREHFELALNDLYRGLRDAGSLDDRHLFKAKFDDLVTGLIAIYGKEDRRDLRLAGLFEHLRRRDQLGEADSSASDLLRGIQSGNGDTARRMGELGAVFLWVQAVNDGTVFGIVRAGRAMILCQSPKTWTTVFRSALKQIRGLLGSSEMATLIEHPAAFGKSAPNQTIRTMMSKAFDLLPPEVQEIVAGGDTRTIFISPCPNTIDFPFELLLPPHDGGERHYAGLSKLFARVHGLQEFSDLLSHGSVAQGRWTLVGDPDTGTKQRLEYAMRTTREIKRILDQAGLPVESACAGEATRAWMLERPRDPRLAFFMFSGHGSETTLAAAATECVSVADLTKVAWRERPLLHLDCCNAGTNPGRGGGNFTGLPAECLRRGAGAILASAHPLYDSTAAVFSRELYASLLTEHSTLGNAILQARRQIDRTHGGNPFLWATTVLWGSPEIIIHPETIRLPV